MPSPGRSCPAAGHKGSGLFEEIWKNATLEEGAADIRREFRFRDFAEAMRFARHVGELSEAEGHHPDVSVGWGYCTVRFRTHAIKGLHENDFIMAAKVGRLAPP